MNQQPTTHKTASLPIRSGRRLCHRCGKFKKIKTVKSLNEIIEEAVPIVREQLNDSYEKHHLENEFKWKPWKPVEGDVMPEILKNWGINEDRLILIECIHHDVTTQAFEFKTVAELEAALKGKKFFLNPFCTYVIPFLRGKVRGFSIYDEQGNKFEKYEIEKLPDGNYEKFQINWD